MEKVWAQKAGLGWQGKHTNLITKDFGSWVFLGVIILNQSLEFDQPFTEDLCGTCTACIDACPTDAISSYQINSNKCISYRTIEHRGSFNENENNLDGWIYGCDICQDVCPWNIKFSQITTEKSFLPKGEIVDWSDDQWDKLNELTYNKLFKGSSVKRTKYVGLKRNISQNYADLRSQKMKVGVLLSGCGNKDGSEIHESVLTMLALDRLKAEMVLMAPNIDQMHVMNHYTDQEMDEFRNVLVESARIARGNIKDMAEVNGADLDALIIPGGLGVVKNLSDYAMSGPEYCKSRRV